MYTIKNNVENKIIIKNSKFICLLRKIRTKEEIDFYLKEAKLLYPGATHYCYAYILDNEIKASDDNEPNNTASLPMLNILKKNNLNCILAIVIRYFGGIKLGANGLVRAYSNSVIEALKKDNIKEIIKGKNIDLTFEYSLEKQIDFILKDMTINNKVYKEKIIYNVDITDEILDKLTKYDINIKINYDTYI